MVMSKNVLVTGGSGFLGSSLSVERPNWTYVSSKDCDLTDSRQVAQLFGDLKPDSILHLAARVGGIKDNIENQADFFHINTMMNTNVIHQAYKAGIERVLSALSTCAFPEQIDIFPFEERELFDGPPTETNFSYGMTKRMLHVASCAYRNQYGMNYSTFSPSNIYGPGDHFGKEASHFVAALIHKTYVAKPNTNIELWGSGLPLRQQIYIDDLCKIIPILLERHDTNVPLIVAPTENISILEMSRCLIEQIDKNVRLLFNGEMDGQFRKDGSNSELMKLIGPFEFMPFREGVIRTYNWYLENQKNEQ
jgi:GDP-L-fucose synthase